MSRIFATMFVSFLISTNSHSQTYLITLGKGENCTGFNICSIQLINGESKLLPNETTISISLTKEHKLQFSFPKSKMKETIFLKYFSTGYFILDGDYKLPDDIVRQYNTSQIKGGKYKVIATSETYEVNF